MSDDLFSVADKVVLVSGGSRGIGRALAQAFARRCARVVVTGREQASLDEAVAGAGEVRYPMEAMICDVAQPDSIRALVSNIVERFGRIDVLLNVAGVNRRMKIEDFKEEDYDFILDINLKGAFLLSQEVGKQMIEQGGGSMININSLNSFAPLPGVGPYAMSKGGLGQMTRSFATEWGKHGIRVNGISPGFIITDLTRKLWSEPHMQEWATTNTPLEQKLGQPEDMVGAAIFLASDAAAWMTGQTIYVDGGVSSGINWPIELD